MPKFIPLISTDKATVKPKELVRLWASVDWCKEGDYYPQTIKSTINKTTCVVSARNESRELIGVARVMSDDNTLTWLAELIVHPDYQSLGVGKRLVDVVKKKYAHTTILLETFLWNRKFFKKCGFVERDLIVFRNY